MFKPTRCLALLSVLILPCLKAHAGPPQGGGGGSDLSGNYALLNEEAQSAGRIDITQGSGTDYRFQVHNRQGALTYQGTLRSQIDGSYALATDDGSRSGRVFWDPQAAHWKAITIPTRLWTLIKD